MAKTSALVIANVGTIKKMRRTMYVSIGLKSSSDYGQIGFAIMVCLTPIIRCYAAFDRQRNAMVQQMAGGAFPRRFSRPARPPA
jgi:hypothetical protein